MKTLLALVLLVASLPSQWCKYQKYGKPEGASILCLTEMKIGKHCEIGVTWTDNSKRGSLCVLLVGTRISGKPTPFGNLYVKPVFTLFGVGANVVTSAWDMPNDARLVGLKFAFQGFVHSPHNIEPWKSSEGAETVILKR